MAKDIFASYRYKKEHVEAPPEPVVARQHGHPSVLHGNTFGDFLGLRKEQVRIECHNEIKMQNLRRRRLLELEEADERFMGGGTGGKEAFNPLPVKVSQPAPPSPPQYLAASFDVVVEVLKENIEDCGMEVDEAIEDARAEFTRDGGDPLTVDWTKVATAAATLAGKSGAGEVLAASVKTEVGDDAVASSRYDKGTPRLIYHAVQKSVWDAARATDEGYLPSTYEQDGFIRTTHDGELLVDVLNHFYQTVDDSFLCLELDTDVLTSVVKMEARADTESVNTEGPGPTVFPRILGPIEPMVCVLRQLPVKRDADGRFLCIPGL